MLVIPRKDNMSKDFSKMEADNTSKNLSDVKYLSKYLKEKCGSMHRELVSQI